MIFLSLVGYILSGAQPDLRVTIGFGTKAYGIRRLSIITPEAEEVPSLSIKNKNTQFEYSKRFEYKWRDNAIHTVQVLPPKPGAGPSEVAVKGLPDFQIPVPAQGAGVAGVLIGDPCVVLSSITSLVGCEYGLRFKTGERTPALLNAFVGGSPNQTDFFGILGDNFYDRDGKTTKHIFSELSTATKATPLLTVPGNHDYWILGEPAIHTQLDQFANGHMQFYAQDTKAAEFARPGAAGAAAVPFNFSNDPTKGQLPALENAFQYYQIGNLGVVGFSGAYTLEQSLPYMKEACTWFGEKAEDGKLEVAMMVGHWDVAGMGASDAMATPGFYEHMKVLPGCKELDAKGMLKFFMGHTHCNVPHPHGHLNTGFMVAGQGMEGCGNYGIPILDTTGGRVRVYYFPIDDKKNAEGADNYDTTMSCLKENNGWRKCLHLATTWLDQPIA